MFDPADVIQKYLHHRQTQHEIVLQTSINIIEWIQILLDLQFIN